jgi:hypothetical protein
MGLFDTIRSLRRNWSLLKNRRRNRAPGKAMPTSDHMPRDTPAQAILADVVKQAIEAGDGWRIKLSASPRWQALKDEPAELQREVMLAAIDPPRQGSTSYSGDSWQVRDAKRQIVGQLLRRKSEVPVDQLASLLARLFNNPYSLEYAEIPPMALLQACEHWTSQPAAFGTLRPALERLRSQVLTPTVHRQRLTKFEQGFVDKVAAMLDPAAAAQASPIPPGAFGQFLTAQLSPLPAGQRQAWEELAGHAAKVGDKSAPTAKWLSQARPMLQAVGAERFAATLIEWLGATTPDPEHPDNSLDVLKGLIWLAPEIAEHGLGGAVGRFAETCFRKVSGVGARSVKLGNATLYALSEMAEDPQAGAELFRLRGVIKYPSARAVLDKRIAELAKNSGTGIAALEDAALPRFGLEPDGTLRRDFGTAAVLLRVTATASEVSWTSAEGKPLKSVPAAVKRDSKAELAAFTLLAKDIEKARAAQARRLEDSWLEARRWSLVDWRRHYLDHPLRRALVCSLIWQAVGGERSAAFMPEGDRLLDVSGAPIQLGGDAQVALWHPLNAAPEEVLAWRARIVERELTQPIKQAHREIYVVTDAELRTETYSNRFAAHILRQHQFRALCQARDWRYDYMGGWDSWNVPTRTLPALGLRAEYAVETIDDGQRSEAYIPLHLATDQVRFVIAATNAAIQLIDVDPVVFSELMRDVDLFVAVTSVAADPAWHDGGPDGRFGTYWREWAFGDLGQSAETRKQLIAGIAPRLSIADKLEIGEKALIVTGKRHKYAIHFGSANIQILPANRYLCIVPDRGPQEAEKIRLPFTGDGQLSTILAKAFLLVDESKIADPTILRQL